MTLDQAEQDVEDGKRAQHDLKCWPSYFEALCRGAKNFEVRRDDRGFQKGDILKLEEWDPRPSPHGMGPGPSGFTGNAEVRLISYILTGGQFGIEPGYVVLGLEKLDEEAA